MDANKQLANMKGITYRSYNDAFANNFYYSYANGCGIPAPGICPPNVWPYKKLREACLKKQAAYNACKAQKAQDKLAGSVNTNELIEDSLGGNDGGVYNGSNSSKSTPNWLIYGGIGLGVIIIGVATYLIIRKK